MTPPTAPWTSSSSLSSAAGGAICVCVRGVGQFLRPFLSSVSLCFFTQRLGCRRLCVRASVSCCQYRAALVSTLPYTQFKPCFFFITGCKQRDDDDDDDFCFVFWGKMWNLILESFTENKIFYILKKLVLQSRVCVCWNNLYLCMADRVACFKPWN